MTAMLGADTLLVTQYYRPELIGSGPYCGELAEFLAERGGSVTVLTGMPHYPYGEVFAAYRGRGVRRETVNGLAVERIRSWIPRRRSTIARIVSEADFLLRGSIALVTRRVARGSLVVSLCPSILSVLLGVLARRRGGRHIAVVHDIQSGLARGLGMVGGGRLAGLMQSCERAVLNRADLVVVLSEEMRCELERNGVTAPIAVVPIWVDTESIRPLPRPEGPLRVLYSGNLGRKQGLDQVIALAEELQHRRPDIEVTLRGDGGQASALAEAIRARGLTNVAFAPLVPRERLSEGLSAGDIHLVPQNPEAADFAVPSKVFAIMAAGRPFVATAHLGSPLWHLQEASGGFLCARPGHAQELADMVVRLADDSSLRHMLGMRGRAFVERKLAKG
jgi:colanic acid biosynthesis glycosyl transferase WcaI